jgi:hypothetical protein
MPKPTFFIPGAPKCGTTALAYWLSEHPSIYMSPVKEPIHFYAPYGDPLPLAQYEELFEGAEARHLAVGEASPQYLSSASAISRILDYQPEAKFVVCVRNPAEMAVSFHNLRTVLGDERVGSFEAAWQLTNARASGRSVGIAGPVDPRYLAYGRVCAIGSQLQHLISCAGRERVYLFVVDDLREAPRQAYLGVLRFLGVPDDGRTEFGIVNPALRLRSRRVQHGLEVVGKVKDALGVGRNFGLLGWLARANKGNGPYSSPSRAMQEELVSAFEPEVRKLEAILGRDLSAWRELPQAATAA